MTCTGSSAKLPYKGGVDAFVLWGMDDDMFWLVRAKNCKSKNYKATLRTGSSWRILADI